MAKKATKKSAKAKAPAKSARRRATKFATSSIATPNPWDELERRRAERNAQMHFFPAPHDAVVAWFTRRYRTKWSPPPARFATWLSKVGVPESLARVVMHALPNATIDTGPASIYSAKDIERADPRLIASELLPIGSSISGDPIVLELRTSQRGAVGIVGHDIFWESEKADPRASLRYVAGSLTAYLLAVARAAVPWDYWGGFDSRNDSSRWKLVFEDDES